MASAQRQHDDIVAFIEKEGSRFGFFQAVDLLHRLIPNTLPVGELGPPAKEPVRFHHDPSLAFQASDVSSIALRTVRDEIRATMTTTFLGLTGSSSPMATVFAEDVLRAESADETSLRAFYDLFHHRLISLFYRTWKKYRFTVGFKADGTDVFSRRMLSFVGVDIGGATHQHGLNPLELLGMAPLLATRTRSSRMLNIILERALPEGAALTLEQFVARRVTIEPNDRILLGRQRHQLAATFLIGKSVIDRSGRFRVTVGPVDQETYEALMPGGARHEALRDIILQFVPPNIEPELELLMSGGTAACFQLGSAKSSSLGVSTRIPLKDTSGAVRARILLTDPDAMPQIFPAGEPPPEAA
jgi:type VI secretion system protein ImpH